MRPVALSDEIAVGEMPTAEEIAILSKAGFRSLLNVQPDGEVARLLSAADVGKATVAAGMAYAAVPIESRRPADDRLGAFAEAMAGLPRPIYACCYSGARAAAGWALAMAPYTPPQDIAAACATAGFDMSAIMPEVERRHAGGAKALLISVAQDAAPAAALPAAASAPAASAAVEKIFFPRAAGAGGFAVSG